MATNVDLSGNVLYVTDVVVGSNTPGILSGDSLSVGATVTSVTTSTLTPTATQSGAVFLLNRAAGSTVTLPAPVVGLTYTFMVGTALSSGSYKVITSAGTVFIVGSIVIDKAGVLTAYQADGSTIVSVNFNGTTTGGAALGDNFTLTCISATEWAVSGVTQASGTLASPFATS